MSTEPPLPIAQSLAQRLAEVRAHSLEIAAPLSDEDQAVQSMPDASPTKWHLAHTTWFFERLVLCPFLDGYTAFDPAYDYLFNSYYESVGARHPRAQRGLLTRPSIRRVRSYRHHVDCALLELTHVADTALWNRVYPLLMLGIQHEQQHQELILTDILHALSANPTLPAYRQDFSRFSATELAMEPPRWLDHPGGIVEVGRAQEAGHFVFDNESPRHAVYLQPYAIADRLVTNGDFANFVADDGYRRPEFWLAEGWNAVLAGAWRQPTYWLRDDDRRFGGAGDSQWYEFGLGGPRPLTSEAPVLNLSFFEAAAYAQWANARLPTEFEWEASFDRAGIAQMMGFAWQWTRSSYDPYPGFRPFIGATAEYNGKFMAGQRVLRGSSFATRVGHSRSTYRNFFPPAARWQFSGLRLARDI